MCPSSAPTLSHTSPASFHPPYSSALSVLAHSFGLASPSPTPSTPSLPGADRLDVSSHTSESQAAAKKADTTGASLKSLNTRTPTPPPAESPSQHIPSPGTLDHDRKPTVPITLKNKSDFIITYTYSEDRIEKGGVLHKKFTSQKPIMFHLNHAYTFRLELGQLIAAPT